MKADLQVLVDDHQPKRNGKKEEEAEQKVFQEKVMKEIEEEEYLQCCICYEDAVQMMVTACCHLMCRECMHLLSQKDYKCPVCRQVLTNYDFLAIPQKIHASPFYQQTQHIPSSKETLIFQHITQIVQSGEKLVIFTQFIQMMDIIAQGLTRLSFPFERMDGKSDLKQKNESISNFKNKKECQVFLISLKTGGVGLNLVEANHVLMVDPWWNPAIEQQAINRVHRVGQTKKVKVIRFIVQHSIEQRMLEMHQHKLSFNQVIHNNNQQLHKKFDYLLQ